MIAEKIRKLLGDGVECIDQNLVAGEKEHDQLMVEYQEALIELEKLEQKGGE